MGVDAGLVATTAQGVGDRRGLVFVHDRDVFDVDGRRRVARKGHGEEAHLVQALGGQEAEPAFILVELRQGAACVADRAQHGLLLGHGLQVACSVESGQHQRHEQRDHARRDQNETPPHALDHVVRRPVHGSSLPARPRS